MIAVTIFVVAFRRKQLFFPTCVYEAGPAR
jgi:hypothetical protein